MHFKINLIKPIMKKTFLFLSVAALLGSCCNNNTNTKQAQVIADSASHCSSLTIDSFLVAAPGLLGKEVTVSGTVDHVCKHGGKRVKLIDLNTKSSIHGEATEAMGSFNAEIEGNTICITGIVAESKMDLAYVEEYEKSVKEAMEKKSEEAEMDHTKGVDHHAQLDKIAKWKEEIATNGKGYISSYYIDVTKFHECKGEEPEGCCSHASNDSAKTTTPCAGDEKKPCGDSKKDSSGCGEKH